MSSNSTPSTSPPSIRLSRALSPARAIALGSSVSVGLGVFVLSSPLLQGVATLIPRDYLAALLLLLPLVLTYAERGVVTSGSGGALSLARASQPLWQSYAIGWLLLGGHLALIALLGWGAAFYLNLNLERLLDLTVDLRWTAPVMVLLVALNDLIGTQGNWRWRTLFVYGAMLCLLVVAAWSWGQPDLALPTDVPPAGLIGRVALLAAGLWGVQFVLDSRDELRNPARHLGTALIVPWLLFGGLGVFATTGVLRIATLPTADGPFILGLPTTVASGGALIGMAYAMVGLLICLIALDRAMVTLLRLIGSMVRDGFLPQQLLRHPPGRGMPYFALRLFALVSALAAWLLPLLLLLGLVALALLWVTALLNLPDAHGRWSRLPTQRPWRLPFHPLFPGLALVISIFLPLALPLMVLQLGLGWGLLGLGAYLGYARHAALDVRRREVVLGEIVAVRRPTTYTVLVGVANPATAPTLIRSAAQIAAVKQGRVLVLQVALFPDQVPLHVQRQEAAQQFAELQQLIDRAAVTTVPVEATVRLAQTSGDGILSTAVEEKVDLIVLGWEGEIDANDIAADHPLELVVRAATCDVVVLRGCLPQTVQRVLVPTAGSPNTLAAIKLAQELTAPTNGQVVALNLAEGLIAPGSLDQTRRTLRGLIDDLGGEVPVDLRVVPSSDVCAGVLEQARSFDMLILGASRGGILDQTIFGGLPVEIARAATLPVLLLKHYEGTPHFWLRRTWELISAPLPSLTLSQRTAVYQQMRQSARPSVDFFVLIGLAALIATMGLSLSSPAVIIGAMLVAPLMSPILAMAMGIVQGNLRMVRMATGTTALGIVLAITVGIVMTLASPARFNTSEILARTQPNLLDLFVALASGAAGGYAIGRKEVAAALPGVAIAAALVPPLSVAGYGMATSQLAIAGGALLLFTTNLIAIVCAAALVFLLLGFRPLRASQREQVRAGFMVVLAALLLISIPLAAVSFNAFSQVTRQNQIETLLATALASENAHISAVGVERAGNGFIVSVTIYALDDFSAAQVNALQESLHRSVGAPVTLRATVLRALLLPDPSEALLEATPGP